MALSNKPGRINGKGGLSSSLPGGAEPSKLLYPGSTGKEGGARAPRIWTVRPPPPSLLLPIPKNLKARAEGKTNDMFIPF